LNIVVKFADKLEANQSVKIRRAKNIYEKSGYPLMYIKGGEFGFWGLTANIIERLTESGEVWKAVLLDSEDTGYVLAAESVNEMIGTDRIIANKDGDYKLNKGGELAPFTKIDSFQEIVAAISGQPRIDIFINAKDEHDVVAKAKGFRKEDIEKLLSELNQQLNNPIKFPINTERFLRGVLAPTLLKELHDYKCQVCEFNFRKEDGSYYAEVGHIVALENGGTDTPDNMAVLCPNHHKILDKGDKSARASVLASLGTKGA